MVALTGDLHHYCRFQEVGGSRQLITAGGGGALFYPTHKLPKRLGKELKPHPDSDVPEFERGSTSPTRAQSLRVLLRTLLMPLINPEVAVLGGTAAALVFGVYFLGANRLLGMHDNEAFSALRIRDFKNFLRLHFDESGGLTIYPVGVERVVDPVPHLI